MNDKSLHKGPGPQIVPGCFKLPANTPFTVTIVNIKKKVATVEVTTDDGNTLSWDPVTGGDGGNLLTMTIQDSGKSGIVQVTVEGSSSNLTSTTVLDEDVVVVDGAIAGVVIFDDGKGQIVVTLTWSDPSVV